MEPRSLQNLKPREIVELARARSKLLFTKAIDSPTLLVRIEAQSSELELVLAGAVGERRERLEPTIGYDTVIGATTENIRSLVQSPLSARPFGHGQLQARLARATYFVVPLCKRSTGGKAFSDRISVGRALNNDIPLRHQSVSKFHAWFECDDDGAFYVSDAGSKNGTLINHAPILRGSPLRLSPGDQLGFGEVEVIYCPADLLWEVITDKR
jgi:hypothetical protein